MSERVIRGLAPEARYVQKAKQIGNALIEQDGNILIGKDLEVDGKMTVNSASNIITKDGSSIGGLPFDSASGKATWGDYEYSLPTKSGTLALTSDLQDAGTSVTIRRW